MSVSTILNPNDPELERFLYAPVGTDREGSTVSMLSLLARLKLDPWDEAAALAGLSRVAARQRLGDLLARSLDVPALGHDHHAVAESLATLLPKRRIRQAPSGSGDGTGRSLPWGMILTILVLVYVMVRMIFTGEPGPGGG